MEMNRSGQYPLLAKSSATLAMLSPEPYVPCTNTIGRCVVSHAVSLTTTGHSASADGAAASATDASATDASTVTVTAPPSGGLGGDPPLPTQPAPPRNSIPTPATALLFIVPSLVAIEADFPGARATARAPSPVDAHHPREPHHRGHVQQGAVGVQPSRAHHGEQLAHRAH